MNVEFVNEGKRFVVPTWIPYTAPNFVIQKFPENVTKEFSQEQFWEISIVVVKDLQCYQYPSQ